MHIFLKAKCIALKLNVHHSFSGLRVHYFSYGSQFDDDYILITSNIDNFRARKHFYRVYLRLYLISNACFIIWKWCEDLGERNYVLEDDSCASHFHFLLFL